MSSCNTFNYCQSKSHENCEMVMASYFKWEGDTFICSKCSVLVNGWESFKKNHANHVVRFMIRKKEFVEKCKYSFAICVFIKI